MQRSIAVGLTLVLLAGCAAFSASEWTTVQTPDYDKTPVSLQQMRLLQAGEWYAVRLPERDGRSTTGHGIFRTGYVGRLQQSDDDSLTLTDVTKCTIFMSKPALRHLPLVGSKYAGQGWMKCTNEPHTVAVPRSNVMWFEPISEVEADKFRRYDEIMNEPIQMLANDPTDGPTSPFGVLDTRTPNEDFLHPCPRREEVRLAAWVEARQMKSGQWYRVLAAPERRHSPHQTTFHVGVVDRVGDDGVYFTNVTTGCPDYEGPVGSETAREMMLRFAEIERVTPLTAEEAEEVTATFNRRRERLAPGRE